MLNTVPLTAHASNVVAESRPFEREFGYDSRPYIEAMAITRELPACRAAALIAKRLSELSDLCRAFDEAHEPEAYGQSITPSWPGRRDTILDFEEAHEAICSAVTVLHLFHCRINHFFANHSIEIENL